jgi:hypothetical protein
MENTRPKNSNRMTIDYEEGKYQNNEYKYGKEPKLYEIQIDAIKAKRQCKLIIESIEVYFPYPPYTNQLAYMEKGRNL